MWHLCLIYCLEFGQSQKICYKAEWKSFWLKYSCYKSLVEFFLMPNFGWGVWWLLQYLYFIVSNFVRRICHLLIRSKLGIMLNSVRDVNLQTILLKSWKNNFSIVLSLYILTTRQVNIWSKNSGINWKDKSDDRRQI